MSTELCYIRFETRVPVLSATHIEQLLCTCGNIAGLRLYLQQIPAQSTRNQQFSFWEGNSNLLSKHIELQLSDSYAMEIHSEQMHAIRRGIAPVTVQCPASAPKFLDKVGKQVARRPGPGLIVATLAICWMPNQVRRIMAAAKPKQDWTVPYFRAYITLLPIADSFFYLSSVLNPLLYNISSQQFRSVFLQVLRCRLTIEHANKEKFLRANPSSSTRSSRSLRPLLFLSSRRSSSTRGSNKVFLSTFQKETKSDCSPEKPPEPSLEVAPLETSAEPSPDAQNGLCEHQV
ncbi:hypothetical protein Q9966_015130 [Columba livia]|nr:hypothetical protein Q9966_015130 [Columba livia]